MSVSALVVRGSPKEFDAFLRPAARGLQLFVGILATLVLLWFQAWWWLPIPLAASFLLYELFFWSRADKPLKITLEPDRVVLEDAFLQSHATFWLRDVDSATLCHRAAPDGAVDAVLQICSPTEILVALQLRLPAAAFEPRPSDVDLDLCNAVLGSISGVIRALAPRDRMIRQPVADPAALAWFREHLPAEAWERTTVRFWGGATPDLDLFGYHSTAHDGLLRLSEGAVRFTDRSEPEALAPLEPAWGERRAVLFRMDGEAHEEAPEQLPLWLQALGDRTVAIPAPLTVGQEPQVPLTDALIHVHAPEGAAILWHLFRSFPEDRWPEGWREALLHARVNLEHWPEGIPAPGGPA